MTKIKNTKKGMAKKTLSVSLAVAMLATSNVPVWAAEFSDGSEAAFTSEVEASVVDVETPEVQSEETPVAQITESSDLNWSDIKVSSSATFATGEVKVSGDIYVKNGTGEPTNLTNYSFGWRVKGETTAIFTDEVGVGNDSTKMSFTPDFANTTATVSQAELVDWSKYAGKTLELYIFNNEDSDDSIKIDPTVIGTTTINKCPMTGKLLLSSRFSSDPVYNGKDYYYTNNNENQDDNAVYLPLNNDALSITSGDTAPGTATSWKTADVLKYFTVSSNTAKNYGDKLVVKATAKEDSPYMGTIESDALTVQKRTYNASEFEFTVDDGLSYSYIGNHDLVIPTEKVHFKETTALAGADLSAAVKTVKVSSGFVGNTTVRYTLDADKLANFSGVPSNEITGPVSETVTVTKRDLKNDCVITVNNGKVPYDTALADLAKCFTFKGKDGTVLTLVNQYETPGTPDYNIKVVNKRTGNEVNSTLNNTDTYTVTITAYEAPATEAGTCINGQTFDIEVSDDVLTSVVYKNTSYQPVYTGVAIEPSVNDFGSLSLNGSAGEETVSKENYKITGYKNNTNAATYKDSTQKTWAYATVEILKGKYKTETFDVPFTILPLQVSADTVTVPKTISINKGYGEASDYKVPLVITAKDTVNGTVVKGLSESDYSIKYEYINGTLSGNKYVPSSGEGSNELHDFIKATITVKNPNFMGTNGAVIEIPMPNTKYTEIVEKAITNDMIKINPSSYTYTGGNITPSFVVMDGAIVLYDKAKYADKGEYEVVSVTNNKEVGNNTATVTVKGLTGKYTGTASSTFSITPANTSDVKVEFTAADERNYTGEQVRPRTFKATLNGNDVTNQFQIVGYGENISGKGTVELRPVDGNKNFTGSNITAEFNIVKEVVSGKIAVYNTNGQDVTTAYSVLDDDGNVISGRETFDFDGTAKTFANALLTDIEKENGGYPGIDGTTAKADDFEVKYVDNVSGKYTGINGGGHYYNIAYVYAVAKDGTGYEGEDSIVTADGTVIKNVVAKMAFAIKDVKFVDQNVSVKDATYAGGLPVKPDVLVQINRNTLVEGKDYTVKLTSDANGNNEVTAIDVTDGKVYYVTVTGINGYTGSATTTPIKWGVNKKDFKDCDIKVTDGVVTVMNGYIPVPTTEYTSERNADGTYTVTANKASKGYTGSKTVSASGKAEDEKPNAPVLVNVKVVGNKATAVLSGEAEGATGYDYVISTDRDCITNKDYDKIEKNKLTTEADFTYVQQGVYYAYCHAWKRDSNGKKIFSDWSNAYPFVVSAITPDQPVITNVKVSGSTVTVTYTKAANADGYDVVLGSEVKKVAGENRPVNYGTLVKKNIKGDTVTATFKNVPKGTYYAGLHAFNRTSEDGKKVFSAWSNAKKVTVK